MPGFLPGREVERRRHPNYAVCSLEEVGGSVLYIIRAEDMSECLRAQIDLAENRV